MSSTALVPANNFSFTMPSQGVQTVKTPAVVDFTGSPINLSAYVSLQMNLFAPSATGNAAPEVVQTPAVVMTPEADGTIHVILDPTLITSIAPGGSLNAAIYGKATSGSDLQLLAQGQIKAGLF